MNCPACHYPLAETTEYSVRIDTCTHCGGVWLDRGELPTLIRARAPNPDKVFSEALFATFSVLPQGNCPRCDAMSLFKGIYLGVSYLKCSSCKGLFFASNEMKNAADTLSSWKVNPEWRSTDWSPILALLEFIVEAASVLSGDG